MATFAAALAIITWDEVKVKQRFPHPDVFVHAGIVWAILGVIAELGVPELAALFGAGLVLSMLYIYYNPKLMPGPNPIPGAPGQVPGPNPIPGTQFI